MDNFFKTLLFTTCFTLSLVSVAQKQNQMEMPQQASVPSIDDNDRIFLLINEANDLSLSDPQTSLDKVEQALQLSFQMKNKRGEAYCYNTLGALNYGLKRFDLSADYYKKAIALFSEVEDNTGLYNSYKYIGMAYEGNKEYDQSLHYFTIFLDKAIAKGDKEDEITVMKRLAHVYYTQEKYSQSEEWYAKVLAEEKSRSNEDGMAEANGYLGLVNEAQGKNEQAVVNYNTANNIALNTNNSTQIEQTYGYLGDYYRNQKKSKKELEVQQQALNANRMVGNRGAENDNNLRIGNILIEQNNPSEAISYLEETINISEEIGELRQLKEANKQLSVAYEEIGDFDKALESYKKYVAIADSLLKEKEKETLAALRLSNTLNKKDKEIELLEKDQELSGERFKRLEQENQLRIQELKGQQQELKAQRTITYALIGGLILLAISALLVYRSSQQKKKAHQLMALQSLRSQMNPHFIFNSLNSVNSFISKNDDRSANKFLSEFSKLMRSVMENSKYDFVPLASELEILKRYLNLEHFRFQDKFDYTFEVDETINEDGVEIPPMLIQPYIENAVWHGLRYKDEKGKLKVQFVKKGNYLVAIIEDNGIGRKKSQELKTRNQKESNSTGMKNIEQRLNIINELHGTRLQVNIEDLMDGEECTGTRVEINIPYHKVEAEAA
jgi:two-component system LytT family sensor kinase